METKSKCKQCGNEYIIFNSSAPMKPYFCCIGCQTLFYKLREGYNS